MRFLGFEPHHAIPDAKTVWLFREQLAKVGAIDALFASFDAHPKRQGFLAMSGQIVDATIAAAPRPRNTEDEKKTIKCYSACKIDPLQCGLDSLLVLVERAGGGGC